MNKYAFRSLMAILIFLFFRNGQELYAQSNFIEREKIEIEFLEKREKGLIENENHRCGTGVVKIKVTFKYEPIDRLPTRNINELAAIFTAGVSFLQ